MRPRTIKIGVSMMGMANMPVATVTIRQFADVLQAETDLVCPACGGKPKWSGRYDCSCGATYSHWSRLKRVLKATGEPVVKEKFTEEGSDVVASAYVMDVDEFSKYVDATATEYGIIVKDETSAKNLKKLLIATKNLNKVVIITFKDTYEERVAVLTTSISNRIILREIIPLNLADIQETMKVDLKAVTPQEIQEAEMFVKMLPKAEEPILSVTDYRTKGIIAKAPSEKVLALEQIISRVQA